MTGRDLALEAILAGRLTVEYHPDTGVRVYAFHRQKRRWLEIRAHPHPRSGRLRIVYGPRRQPVYLNVLVWMHEHRRLPDGCVDHRDGNRRNDAPHNLRTHSRAESDKQGADVQADMKIAALCAWFGYIAFWGEEPPPGPVPAWYATWEPADAVRPRRGGRTLRVPV